MLKWKAIYEDGSSFQQFNADGSENLFKDIDQSKLILFALGETISVDLRTGSFIINGLELATEVSNRTEEYRLIYFRRNTITFGGVKTKKVESFIGFQVTINEKNHKFLISEKDGILTLR